MQLQSENPRFGQPYSTPTAVSRFIDLVTQPGLTFRFDPAIGYIRSSRIALPW